MRRRTGPPAATGAAPQPSSDTDQSEASDSDRPTTLTATISATPSELSGLRSRVAEFGRFHGGGDDVVDDLELIVSELATNVIRHTSDHEITVTLRVDQTDTESDSTSSAGQRWTLEVTGASEVPGLDELDEPPADQETGRGLLIVRAVADSVEIDRDAGTMRCMLDG